MIRQVKMRYKIDDHDFGVRLDQVRRYLRAGDTVEVIVIFRGREIQRIPEAKQLLYRIVSSLRTGDDKSYPVSFVIESHPALHGRNMKMTLIPYKEEIYEDKVSS